MNTVFTSHAISRRTAVTGLGAAGLGLALRPFGQTAGQETTAEDITWQRDVVYGEVDGQQLLLDIASPATQPDPRPAIILIHGGGLIECDRYCVEQPIAGLVASGYVVFNIEYRLFSMTAGTNPWPAQLDDAQRAVRWIRANAAEYGVDPERIGAYGHSSGAQLAAFLGTRETRDNADPELADYSSRVTCVIDAAGPMDMTLPSPDPAIDAIRLTIVGGTVDSPPDEAALLDFSPPAAVDDQTVPFLILHGGEDYIVPPEQPRAMEVALHTAKREVISVFVPLLDHFTVLDWPETGAFIQVFLNRHLHPDR